MVLKKIELAGFLAVGLDGWSGMDPTGLRVRELSPLPAMAIYALTRSPHLPWGNYWDFCFRVRYGACTVLRSRDTCHGCFHDQGWRERRVLATGVLGYLVEPTWRLLGIWGGGGNSDSQEIPGDRYLGRVGWGRGQS